MDHFRVRPDADDDVHHSSLLRVLHRARGGAHPDTRPRDQGGRAASFYAPDAGGVCLGAVPGGGRGVHGRDAVPGRREFLLQPRRAERGGQGYPRAVPPGELSPARADDRNPVPRLPRGRIDVGGRAHEERRAGRGASDRVPAVLRILPLDVGSLVARSALEQAVASHRAHRVSVAERVALEGRPRRGVLQQALGALRRALLAEPLVAPGSRTGRSAAHAAIGRSVASRRCGLEARLEVARRGGGESHRVGRIPGRCATGGTCHASRRPGVLAKPGLRDARRAAGDPASGGCLHLWTPHHGPGDRKFPVGRRPLRHAAPPDARDQRRRDRDLADGDAPACPALLQRGLAGSGPGDRRFADPVRDSEPDRRHPLGEGDRQRRHPARDFRVRAPRERDRAPGAAHGAVLLHALRADLGTSACAYLHRLERLRYRGLRLGGKPLRDLRRGIRRAGLYRVSRPHRSAQLGGELAAVATRPSLERHGILRNRRLGSHPQPAHGSGACGSVHRARRPALRAPCAGRRAHDAPARAGPARGRGAPDRALRGRTARRVDTAPLPGELRTGRRSREEGEEGLLGEESENLVRRASARYREDRRGREGGSGEALAFQRGDLHAREFPGLHARADSGDGRLRVGPPRMDDERRLLQARGPAAPLRVHPAATPRQGGQRRDRMEVGRKVSRGDHEERRQPGGVRASVRSRSDRLQTDVRTRARLHGGRGGDQGKQDRAAEVSP